MEQTFRISEVIGTSWDYLKQQIWVLVGLYIGYTILSGLVGSLITPEANTMTFVGGLLSLILGAIFSLGYYKNIFQTLDGIEPQFSAYGQQASKILTYIIANIIYSLIVCIGIIFFIVPGVYLGLRLQFFICLIVEEDAGIIDSLKRSWEITDGHTMNLLFLFLAQIVIAIVGLILLIVGLFVAAPLIITIQCNVFRILNNPLSIEDGSQQVYESL